MNNTKSETVYDTIVIGSGISGMTVARLLSKFGKHKVLLLEQHTKLGGLTHEFARRGKFNFATGFHYIGLRGKKDLGHKLLNLLTDNKVTYSKMNDKFDHFVYNYDKKSKYSFSLSSNKEELKAQLIAKFPKEESAIIDFYKQVPILATEIMKLAFFKQFPLLNRFFYKTQFKKAEFTLTPASEYLKAKFNDKKLISILSTFWGDLGMPPSKLPIGYLAVLHWHYDQGGYYPNGGPKVIAKNVAKALSYDGCDVKLRRSVSEIIMQDNKASGVLVDYFEKVGRKSKRVVKEKYYAKNIVSSVGCFNTFLNLTKKANTQDIKAQLKKLKPSPSACVLFLGLKFSPKKLGFDGGNVWLMPNDNHDQIFSAKPGEGLLYLSFPSLKNSKSETHTIEIISIANYDHFKKWENEPWPRTNKDYIAYKDKIEKKIISKLDKVYPGFKESIEYSTLATPLTVSTFQNSYKGQFYGLPADKTRILADYNKIKTPIKNLYLTGQDVFMPGIISAMLAGLLTTFYLLGKVKSFRMLGIINKVSLKNSIKNK